MLESMACGTPIIAYNHGSVPEILDPGLTGYIVSTIDEAVEAVENVSRLSRRRCRQVFEERFSVERMAHNYLEVYERVAGLVEAA